MKVLVSGASGFVGKAVVARLAADGHQVLAASRAKSVSLPSGATHIQMRGLNGDDEPLTECRAVDVVVHTAARVHVMRDKAANPLSLFRAVNVDGSLSLARQTRAAGAKRFVYLSSLKVYGESTAPGQPLSADSPMGPTDAYGISKLEAEEVLAKFCSESGMELVIIRPPLVYGPGVKANFQHLMRAIARRRPLPLGRIQNNRRSLVALDNLVDLIAVCIDRPAAAGRSFLVSDGEDLSTADLVRRIGIALRVPVRLLPLPVWALKLAATIAGRRDAVQRLCESLQVDISETRRALNWSPPCKVTAGLEQAANHFVKDGCV